MSKVPLYGAEGVSRRRLVKRARESEIERERARESERERARERESERVRASERPLQRERKREREIERERKGEARRCGFQGLGLRVQGVYSGLGFCW